MEKTQRNKICGHLIDENKDPLNDLEVKAFEYSFLKSKELGSAISNINGEFQINYFRDPELSDEMNIKLDILIDDEVVMSISREDVPSIFDFGNIEVNKGNIGIKGRVIDENGNPIVGLAVVAEDVDFGKIKLNALRLVESKIKSVIPETINSLNFIKDTYKGLFFLADDLLGHTITDDEGYYQILYPQSRYIEIVDKRPDIRVIVKDKLGVFEILKTEVYENVESTIKYVDDIVINQSKIEGWFVTLENDSPSRFTCKNNFEILIDNKNALERIVEAIDNAESYIYLTQFEFYPDYIPRFFKSANKETYEEDKPLIYKILEAEKRGTEVKIIINENLVVPDNYDELNSYFKDSNVSVRRFPAKGPYAMHAKVMVVDGKEAFIIGSPFGQAYWDTNQHLINEPRRGKKNEGPVHDVSMYLKGEAIEHIEEFFIELWNYLSDIHFDGKNKILKNKSLNLENSHKNTLNNTNYQNGMLKYDNECLQIVRSITPNTFNTKGEKGILEAYRRAFTNAKDFIYLENQYFTNKYIISALKNALDHNPELQLIMVINEVPDVPTYRNWQHYGFELMGIDLEKSSLDHPRIGIYALWSGGFENGKNKLRHCYVHSKVAIVDDVWATIGSANLDGSSLSCAEEFGSRDSSKNYRNMEMNALFFDFDDPRKGTIKKFRQELWSEHLGVDISKYSRPDNGWLDLWKKTVYDNIEKLELGEINFYGDALPYSPSMTTEGQIKDLVEKYRRIKGRFNF
ncbi:phospholipase D-like domain-containing protein [Methanobacterium oryzae]|uniref:phospholipase D-like domain-containing protein n=1 Tax=Methanobacterium oryzae TaxID=69540 RepID=UPI003D240964